MKTEPRFHYRLGANQPATSPTAKRLAEMAEAILRDTNGAFRLDVFPGSRLGPDPQMFANLQAGKIEFYLAGATLGGIAPSSALPLMPYTFRDNDAVFTALEGDLGDVIRAELARAGLHGFRYNWLNGFHHITTSNRPIATADDFTGLKIRSPGGAIAADFFKTLGAEAGMVPFSGMYAALQAKTFDGQSDPHQVAVALRLYEVQTYLSLTAHWWSGFTLLANAAAWATLPRAVQDIVDRNAKKFALLQRDDIEQVNAAGAEELAHRGVQVNTADTASFRARLGDFYKSWRQRAGLEMWRLLESYAGGIGG